MPDSKPLVLQILPTLSLGGAERFAVELAAQLPALGFETRVISLFGSGPMLDEIKKRNIPYECLLESHAGSRIELVKKLGKVMYGRRAEGRWQKAGGNSNATIPLVQSGQAAQRNYATIIHTHLFGSDFWTAVTRSSNALRPTAYAPIFISTAHSIDRDDGFIRHCARGWAMKRFDRCVGISKTVEGYLAKDLGVRRDHVVGIDGMSFLKCDARPEMPFHAPVRFVSVGRLVQLKGIDTALRALAAIQEPWHYTIVGSGPMKREWRELAERLNIASRIEFIPATTDIASILQSSDCFLFPSHWEGLGSAAIEAASIGLPVLASDLPALQTIFPKPQRIRIGDIKAWTEAIRDLMAHPHAALESTRKRAPAIALRFDPGTVSKKYAELYQEILKGKA